MTGAYRCVRPHRARNPSPTLQGEKDQRHLTIPRGCIDEWLLTVNNGVSTIAYQQQNSVCTAENTLLLQRIHDGSILLRIVFSISHNRRHRPTETDSPAPRYRSRALTWPTKSFPFTAGVSLALLCPSTATLRLTSDAHVTSGVKFT